MADKEKTTKEGPGTAFFAAPFETQVSMGRFKKVEDEDQDKDTSDEDESQEDEE